MLTLLHAWGWAMGDKGKGPRIWEALRIWRGRCRTEEGLVFNPGCGKEGETVPGEGANGWGAASWGPSGGWGGGRGGRSLKEGHNFPHTRGGATERHTRLWEQPFVTPGGGGEGGK